MKNVWLRNVWIKPPRIHHGTNLWKKGFGRFSPSHWRIKTHPAASGCISVCRWSNLDVLCRCRCFIWETEYAICCHALTVQSFASLCHTTQQRIRLSAVVVDVDGRNIRSTRLSWLVNEFWRAEIQKNQSWPGKEKCCFCSACYSHSVGKCSPHAQSALWKKIICTRKITNPLCNCTSIRIININQTQSSVPALYKFPFMGRSWPL